MLKKNKTKQKKKNKNTKKKKKKQKTKNKKKKLKKQSAYLFCAIQDESKASWLTAFWATSMPQKVFRYNLSKGENILIRAALKK